MKTAIIFRTGLMLFSTFIVLSSFAQKADFTNESAFKFSSSEIDKGLPLFSSISVTDIASAEVNEKILKNFNKKFREADGVTWEQEDDNYMAKFSRDGITANSLFDAKGRLIYTINFFSDKQLPVNSKKMLNNKYDPYHITSAAQVLIDNRNIWIVKLAGKTNFIALRIEDGEMSEIENFNRAN